MGGGTWDTSAYTSRTSAKRAAGKDDFDYSATAFRTGVFSVHPSLDPKSVNNAGDHEGKNIRESLDSDEHPDSLAIAVLFDVTGSMGGIPRVLQKKLPKLYGLLLEKGYVEHPQVLYGAIGDATLDRVPLQIGQFESDNRADEALENIILEGGGGGQVHESYELGAYFMARHTYIDCFEKRGKKGYLFFIGDERNYPNVDPRHVADLIGDPLEVGMTTREIFDELREKWEVFFFYAEEGSYDWETIGGPTVEEIDGDPTWVSLLGQNALRLEDSSAVCETIALTVGLYEGTLEDLDAGLADLAAIGTESETTEAVGKALATVGATVSSVATVEGDMPDMGDDDGTERL